jgi:hypothetical protein
VIGRTGRYTVEESLLSHADEIQRERAERPERRGQGREKLGVRDGGWDPLCCSAQKLLKFRKAPGRVETGLLEIGPDVLGEGRRGSIAEVVDSLVDHLQREGPKCNVRRSEIKRDTAEPEETIK